MQTSDDVLHEPFAIARCHCLNSNPTPCILQPYFTRLPIEDRLTALPLIKAMLEYNLDEVHSLMAVCIVVCRCCLR